MCNTQTTVITSEIFQTNNRLFPLQNNMVLILYHTTSWKSSPLHKIENDFPSNFLIINSGQFQPFYLDVLDGLRHGNPFHGGLPSQLLDLEPLLLKCCIHLETEKMFSRQKIIQANRILYETFSPIPFEIFFSQTFVERAASCSGEGLALAFLFGSALLQRLCQEEAGWQGLLVDFSIT